MYNNLETTIDARKSVRSFNGAPGLELSSMYRRLRISLSIISVQQPTTTEVLREDENIKIPKDRLCRQSFIFSNDAACDERSGLRSFFSLSAKKKKKKNSLVLFVERPSARRGPGIGSVDRNVRSKCRCSCVLQFTS